MEELTIHTIKKICKYRKFQCGSLRKQDLINHFDRNLKATKIQRIYRSRSDCVCPITMTIVKYPCFSFRPKGQTVFIYYNLSDLINYLINTGDFRDPKTRQEYSTTDIKVMNSLQKYYKIEYKEIPSKIKMYIPISTNIFKAYNNKKYYKIKKDKENDILIMERCLDDIISSMRNILEVSDRRRNYQHTLNNLLFTSFKIYFKRLVQLSTNKYIENYIQQTIKIINETVDRNKTIAISDKIDVDIIRDNIIQFLYQIQFDEINE